MAERASAETKRKKREKNNARVYEEKKTKKAKNYTQALRELKCSYIKKNVLSLEVNTALI